VAGRLQTHPDDPRVLVDVGHNPLAAEVVARTLCAWKQRAKICVLAMLRDKDASEVARLLDPHTEHWFCAGLAGERGRSGAELAELVSQVVGTSKVSVFESVSEALVAAILGCDDAPGEDEVADDLDLILVFGSFHTAAEALNTTLNADLNTVLSGSCC
jgi:dihydrofolate synthase/folylpolyglutamate synthase